MKGVTGAVEKLASTGTQAAGKIEKKPALPSAPLRINPPRAAKQGANQKLMFSQSLTGEKVTKNKLIEYLKNIHEVPKAQLINDIQLLGLKYVGGNVEKGYYQFVDKSSQLRIRIDGPHAKGQNTSKYPHIHIYDKNGNSLDATLKIVDSKSPGAHIKIQDMAQICMEVKL